MKTRNLLAALLLICTSMETFAQSAIYACGHIRRNRTTAISNLRNSGYTTAILFNVNVESDGTLTTDFSWDSQTAAEAGGIICQDGAYVFGKYQPYYVSDIKNLLRMPTSINRIEICIGGWGNGAYGNIKKFIDANGTGSETMLYKNFKALKEAIPEIVAVNNDQEQDYDVSTAVKFHLMLAEIGYKTTIAPYTNKTFWKSMVEQINAEKPGTCEMVYLQTYGGGSNNNPDDWDVFGGLPMYVGFDCESSSDLNSMVTKFTNWKNSTSAVGGFLWNYNSEARNVNEWASAINRVFGTRTTDQPVGIFYQDINYGGYAIGLPEGEFTQAELALYGVKAKDITSFKLEDGYQVTMFTTPVCVGTGKTWTESTSWIGSDWNDKACAIRIERIGSGIDRNNGGTDGGCRMDISGGILSLSGPRYATIHISNSAGLCMAEAIIPSAGTVQLSVNAWPKGIYIVKCGTSSTKVFIDSDR